jgi:predicted enzyme related to lactoylglutathione lyase
MGEVVQFDIGKADADQAAAFYSGLFGWNIVDGRVHSIGVSGLGHLGPFDEPRSYNLIYVGVDDVDDAIARAKRLGGKVVVGPEPLGRGKFALVTDPIGATVGLWEGARA